MGANLTRRGLHSLNSLAGLIVLAFFLARLADDPTALSLPIDAARGARRIRREAWLQSFAEDTA